MKERRKTTYFVTNERLRTEIAGVRLGKKRKDTVVVLGVKNCFVLFLTFPYPEPVPKKLCDFYWLQLQITCKSGWIAQADKRHCVSKEGKNKITA